MSMFWFLFIQYQGVSALKSRDQSAGKFVQTPDTYCFISTHRSLMIPYYSYNCYWFMISEIDNLSIVIPMTMWSRALQAPKWSSEGYPDRKNDLALPPVDACIPGKYRLPFLQLLPCTLTLWKNKLAMLSVLQKSCDWSHRGNRLEYINLNLLVDPWVILSSCLFSQCHQAAYWSHHVPPLLWSWCQCMPYSVRPDARNMPFPAGLGLVCPEIEENPMVQSFCKKNINLA